MSSVLDAPSPLTLKPLVATPSTPQFRRFGDPAAIRKRIFENTLAAANEIEPVQNSRHTLRLTGVDYADPEDYTYADQKRALLTRGSMGRRLRGTWELMDNVSGQTIAAKQATLGRVPYLTDRGTIIQNGNEYTIAHQLRLRPGVFTTERNNGEYASHINVSRGLGHKLILNPKTGVFSAELGQAKVPLMPLLRTLGVSDKQMRDMWGNELYEANMRKDDPSKINTLYRKLVKYGEPDASTEVKREAIAKAFADMEIDPEITKRTLGTAYDRITPDALMHVTRRLLAVNRGEEDVDDRDDMAFQRLIGPEDVFAEQLRKARNVSRKILWRSSGKGNLDNVPTGAFNDAMQHAVMNTGLGMPLEEINPADLFDQQVRVTRMGEGGLSADAIPDSSRAVQPSQFGFIDFLRTPESGKVGVDSRMAASARKGDDGKIYTEVIDQKTGQPTYKNAQELGDSIVAFPGEMRKNSRSVAALVNGRVRVVPRDRVNFVIPHMENTFSPLGQLIPLKSMVKGQRAVMAARMLTQALPLTDPEAPFVQSGMPGIYGRSFEEEYGKQLGAIHSSVGGTITNVAPGGISIRDQDGKVHDVQTYDNFPFNRKTYLHNQAMVKVGDTVKPGQLLASSNYTSNTGVAALGKNARVAYIPFEGLNFEDASVVSESFAKRMRSEHMYQHGLEWEKEHLRGKSAYMSAFPTEVAKLGRARLAEAYDDRGFVRPGTIVREGDPLVLMARQRERNAKTIGRSRPPSDESIKWEHHNPGVVTDVEVTEKGATVVVKSASELEVGDKLSGRYGDKGVVSRIVPDDQMPTNKDGQAYEVLLNPLGVISRTNPAQIVEAALGKIVALTGKPYKLQDFGDMEDVVEFAINELHKHGVADTESIIDPKTERRIDDVFTGNRWFMKLHHTSESKAQGRGLGSYTSEMSPAKGGTEGAKMIGMLELNALLSHGATEVVRDVKLVRGQANPQYWAQFQMGNKPPTPQVPHVYEKFVNQLKGAGINVVRNGTRMHIMGMTDKDIDTLAGDRELKGVPDGRGGMTLDTVDWRNMAPKKGGLFDPGLTGGHAGNRWAYIKLHEPMPNPVMEEPIRHVLGLTEQQLHDVMSGKEKLQGRTGPRAISMALTGLNVKKELERAELEIRTASKSSRDKAVRRHQYLQNAERLGVTPGSWVMNKVPVLPPMFRPISTMGPKKLPLVDDANHLYKELFDANQRLKDANAQLGEHVGEERLSLYSAFKGVTGLGDPIHPKNRERKVKGILKHVFGSSPKLGVVQRRLLATPVDLVGRSVITPDPDLDMDEVGLPEERAWDIYKPFIVRNVVRRAGDKAGARMQALRSVKERSPLARQALIEEMGKRPVIINRAPTLHRYGMMAAYPRLIRGDVLKVSPLVVGGFNADFDGDAMQYHVPATDEAAEEAMQKMLPSRNLFSAANFGVHYLPSQEYTGGLYEASTQSDTKNQPRVFATKAEAIRAYKRGEIGIGRRVEIIEQ